MLLAVRVRFDDSRDVDELAFIEIDFTGRETVYIAVREWIMFDPFGRAFTTNVEHFQKYYAVCPQPGQEFNDPFFPFTIRHNSGPLPGEE